MKEEENGCGSKKEVKLTIGLCIACLCLFNQLVGSLLLNNATVFVCRRLDRSYHAEVINLFSLWSRSNSSCLLLYSNPPMCQPAKVTRITKGDVKGY